MSFGHAASIANPSTRTPSRCSDRPWIAGMEEMPPPIPADTPGIRVRMAAVSLVASCRRSIVSRGSITPVVRTAAGAPVSPCALSISMGAMAVASCACRAKGGSAVPVAAARRINVILESIGNGPVRAIAAPDRRRRSLKSDHAERRRCEASQKAIRPGVGGRDCAVVGTGPAQEGRAEPGASPARRRKPVLR